MLEYAPIVRGVASDFFWPGADREDIEQEGWLALAEARPTHRALARVIVRRHLIDKLRGETREKRPRLVALEIETADPHSLEDLVEARQALRSLISETRSPCERSALRRMLLGEPPTSKSEDNARQRVRRRLRAVTP